MLARLEGFPPRDLDRLYSEVRAIAVESGRRDEVKFALAVLGRFGREDDVELLRTFARHEEFTLYAAIALAGIVDDPVDEWLQLARRVHGWGRIELVELLVREPRADACAWLLRHGFRNTIASGETEHLVASHCDLAGTLERERDEELLAGARDILSALAEDGEMLEYEQGAQATERFLELLEPSTSADHLAVESLLDFIETTRDNVSDDVASVSDGGRGLAARVAALGWTDDVLEDLAARCRDILDAPMWPAVVESELARDHESLPLEAVHLARKLGIPVRDFLIRHLEREPGEIGTWYELMQEADAETVDTLLDVARRRRIFEELAEGPALELHRPGFFVVGDVLLQVLAHHPGKGWDVIQLALQSPVIVNRHSALESLSRWPRELLTEEHLGAVARVAEADPDHEVRDAARRLLRGEPVEWPEMGLDDE